MQRVIKHWKFLAIGVVVSAIFIAFGVSLTNAIPISEALSQWSIQEAVFYGFCVLAFATFIAR